MHPVHPPWVRHCRHVIYDELSIISCMFCLIQRTVRTDASKFKTVGAFTSTVSVH